MSNLAIGSLKDSFPLSLEEFIQFEETLFDTEDVAICEPKKYSSLEKIEDVFRSIIPLSLPEKGKDHRTIQLWKYKKGLIASVSEENGQRGIVPGRNIHNALSPNDSENNLLKRLEQIGLRRWQFAYLPDSKNIYIWPNLSAAGIEGERTPPTFPDNPSQLLHIFRSKEGHLPKDTHENRAIILEAIESPKNFVGINNHGNDCYLMKRPDGTQAWAEVRNGKIKNAGLNQKPTKFVVSQRRLVHWADRFDAISPKINIPPTRGRVLAVNVNHAPAHKLFHQTLQQTKLVDSFNANHANDPVPERGMAGGKIGGVASSPDYIEGLFETPESLFEKMHYFCLPTSDGKPPFTNQELQQIIRELTLGIYVHGTTPFFSLHFRQGSADLFPVIHPVYEHTLVGRIFAILDYMMKGYLNGGVFTEKFIDQWHANPDWKAQTPSALQELIDFEQYCQKLQGADQQYLSLKTLTTSLSSQSVLNKMLKVLFNTDEKGESTVLSEFDGFRNSFRIIAHQNSFKKSGNVFLIDADFDVEYTIQPSPGYEQELANYQRKEGGLPGSYNKLVAAFEFMKMRIHDHMQKIPLCKSYFSMLGVIDFLSCYLTTLKRHRKMPNLCAVEPVELRGCPPLFPHLPITIQDKEALCIQVKTVIGKVIPTPIPDWVKYYFYEVYEHLDKGLSVETFSSQSTHTVKLHFERRVEENVLENCSAAFRRFVEQNKTEFGLSELTAKIADEIYSNLLTTFYDCVLQYQEIRRKDRVSRNKMVRNFLKAFIESSPSEKMELTKPIPYKSTVFNSEAPKNEVEKNKRIVGGCGLRLEAKRIQPSKETEYVRKTHWHQLSKLTPESMEPIDIEGVKGVVFGLQMGDVPYELPSDYRWLEPYLFSSADDNNLERVGQMIRIQEAMEENDKNAFAELIKAAKVEELGKMEDRNGASLLCHAAMNSDPFYLETLLQKKVPIKPDKFGYLPAHYAAMKDSEACLKLIDKTTPDALKAKSKNGSTPLTVAIQHEAGKAVAFCLEKTSALTLLAGGYTDLHCALHIGNETIINLLLDTPGLVVPCLNICAEEGGTPLMLACGLKNENIVNKLIDYGASVSDKGSNGLTAIEIACQAGDSSVLEILLKKKAQPTPAAIETVLREGSLDIIEVLADNYSGLEKFKNAHGDTPAHIAAREGNYAGLFMLAQIFPEQFTIKNAEHQTPLAFLLALNGWDIMEYLFDTHSIVPEVGDLLTSHYHPLMGKILAGMTLDSSKLMEYLAIAARRGNYNTVYLILSHKDTHLKNIQPTEARALLPYLAICDAGASLQKLLQKDPSQLNVKFKDGKTLTYIAAENGSYKTFFYLLQKLIQNDISLENHFGDIHLLTPFLLACPFEKCEQLFSSFPELLRISLDKNGMQPIHLAAKWGQEETLAFYLSQKISVGSIDHLRRTVLCYAIQGRQEKCIALLLSKKASISAYDLYQAAMEEDRILEMLMATKPSQKLLDEAMFEAVKEGNYKAVLHLQAHGATFGHIQNGWTPLFVASHRGDKRILSAIIHTLQREAPSQLHFVNREGDSALHLSCRSGHLSCATLLLEAGLDGHCLNTSKQSPLDEIKGKAGLSRLMESHEASKLAVKEFVLALKSGNPEKIEKQLMHFSDEETISIEIDAREIHGSSLLLALRCADHLNLEQARHWIKTYTKSINACDSEGESVAHLLVRKGINPAGLVNLELKKPNREGQTLLHIAAKEGEEGLLKDLISAFGSDGINQVDAKERTPIFYAVLGGDEKKVALLVEKGAYLDLEDENRLTPLLCAVQKSNLRMVQVLVEGGANIDKVGTSANLSPLFASVAGKHREVTHYLMLKGANARVAIKEEVLPIHAAAEGGNLPIFRFLSMERQSLLRRDLKGRQAVHYAASKGHTEILEHIHRLDKESIHSPLLSQAPLQDRTDSDTFFEKATPLHLASLSAPPKGVAWLLNHWTDPEALTQEQKLPMFFGMHNSGAKALFEFFDPYKINQQGKVIKESIAQLILKDNVDAIKPFYDKGIDVNWGLVDQSSGLHLASYSGALHCMAWLLQNGATPESKNIEGQTVFEVAAASKFPETLKLLLMQRDEGLNKRFYYGKTLLHIAIDEGQLSNMLVLLKLDIPLNKTDFAGNTPLHYAVRNNEVEIARVLLAVGADASIRSEFQKIPRELAEKDEMKRLFHEYDHALKKSEAEDSKLHFAVRMKSLHAVRQLLEDVHVNQKNGLGETALHLAIEDEQIEIALLLLQNGADALMTDNNNKSPLSRLEQKKEPIQKQLLQILKSKKRILNEVYYQ